MFIWRFCKILSLTLKSCENIKIFCLVLLQEEKILLSGATDGALQIRTNALHSTKQPNLTLDIQMYDFYSSPIECIAVNEGIVFIGGKNGVFYYIDCSEAGLPPHRKSKSILIIFNDAFNLKNLLIYY